MPHHCRVPRQVDLGGRLFKLPLCDPPQIGLLSWSGRECGRSFKQLLFQIHLPSYLIAAGLLGKRLCKLPSLGLPRISAYPELLAMLLPGGWEAFLHVTPLSVPFPSQPALAGQLGKAGQECLHEKIRPGADCGTEQ